jgi:hypothetical protein
VYIFDVPTDDWPGGVDAREPRMMRKATGKHPQQRGLPNRKSLLAS